MQINCCVYVKEFNGILLHKTDSITGKGISGVTFLLYDSTNKSIGQYTTDNTGYIYIDDLTVSGKYFLREMENKGLTGELDLRLDGRFVQAVEVCGFGLHHLVASQGQGLG